MPSSFSPSRSPFLARAQSTQLSRTLAAARRAGADSGHLSPSCLDSSRCKLRNLALHLLRSISCSIEPSAGRNRSCRPRPPLTAPSSSAPPVELPSPTSLRSNRVAGELLRAPLSLPNPIPARFRGRRRWTTAAPPWSPWRRRCARCGLPPRGSQPRGRAPPLRRTLLAATRPAPSPVCAATGENAAPPPMPSAAPRACRPAPRAPRAAPTRASARPRPR